MKYTKDHYPRERNDSRESDYWLQNFHLHELEDIQNVKKEITNHFNSELERIKKEIHDFFTGLQRPRLVLKPISKEKLNAKSPNKTTKSKPKK